MINQILWIRWIYVPFRENSIETCFCDSFYFIINSFQRVFGEPELIKGRNMHFYLPPSFGKTIYKKVRHTYYRLQRSWGKVMFLQASVILSTWGGEYWPGTPCGTRYTPQDQVHPPRDQVHPPGPGTPPRPGTPPGTRYPTWHRACWEIRSTRGRYASYWNVFLF